MNDDDRFRLVQLLASDGPQVTEDLNEYARRGWAARSMTWIHDADARHGSWWVLLENERGGEQS